MSSYDKLNDPRFHDTGSFTPFVFLGLFVIFVYGALIVGLLGVANWIIHANQLKFFVNMGIWGVILLAFGLLTTWIVMIAIIASIPYYILRANGRYIMASKVATIIVVLLLNILVMPVILWRSLRNSSPVLRLRYRKKLKKMVYSKKMQERLAERRAKFA